MLAMQTLPFNHCFAIQIPLYVLEHDKLPELFIYIQKIN